MKIFNVFKKFEKVRMAICFILVGVLFVVISTFGLTRPDGNFEKVDATITSITTEGTGDDTEYTVMVKYEVDGEKFENELGTYKGNWNVGDTIECEYNVENHAEIRYGDGKLMLMAFCVIGVGAFCFGLIRLIKDIKTPSSELSQYDRVKEIDNTEAEKIRNNNEIMQDYVFHFTGKMNQSYVMKDKNGIPVFEGNSEGVRIFKATKFEFKNLITGESSEKMIGHTISETIGTENFSNTINSSFKIDGLNNWDYLASRGYGFNFSLKGIKCHYDVRHHGVNIGYIETAGTEVMNEKYKNNPLAKLPSNGIYRVQCQQSEIEMMFMICFCVTKTDFTLN